MNPFIFSAEVVKRLRANLKNCSAYIPVKGKLGDNDAREVAGNVLCAIVGEPLTIAPLIVTKAKENVQCGFRDHQRWEGASENLNATFVLHFEDAIPLPVCRPCYVFASTQAFNLNCAPKSTFRKLTAKDSARIMCGGHYRTNGDCPNKTQATWANQVGHSTFYMCDEGKASFITAGY